MSMTHVEYHREDLKGTLEVYKRCGRQFERAVRAMTIAHGCGIPILAVWALGVSRDFVSWDFRVMLVICWGVLVTVGSTYTWGRYEACKRVRRLCDEQAERLTRARLVEAARRGPDGDLEELMEGADVEA